MKGIPTKYASVQFRSRLEAKWAAYFDLCGWPWTYEPFDLSGYIPDFVLRFEHTDQDGNKTAAPVLVEVKPASCLSELEQYTNKIIGSGWDKEILIVGADVWPSEYHGSFSTIGILCERGPYNGKSVEWWAPAYSHVCRECGHISFHHCEGMFFCRVNGCYDGDHYLGLDSDANYRFRDAGNRVQWKKPE